MTVRINSANLRSVIIGVGTTPPPVVNTLTWNNMGNKNWTNNILDDQNDLVILRADLDGTCSVDWDVTDADGATIISATSGTLNFGVSDTDLILPIDVAMPTLGSSHNIEITLSNPVNCTIDIPGNVVYFFTNNIAA